VILCVILSGDSRVVDSNLDDIVAGGCTHCLNSVDGRRVHDA